MTASDRPGSLSGVAVDDETLRVQVYGVLAATGLAPTTDELSTFAGVPATDVREALGRLADQRHLVLRGAEERIVLAHPFATVPLGFAVMGRRTLWWGGCAWDSFALPQLVPDEPDVLVSTRCPGCGRALAWVVGRQAPPDGEEVAHFLVPVARMWDDVVYSCGNQRLFCGPGCVDRWLERTGHARGYVMDLPTLWRLARTW
jgi:hypothetical protein